MAVRRAMLVIAAVLTVASAACGGGKPARLTQLRVGLGPYIVNAATYLAQQKGYFAAEGLNVEFVRFESSTTSFPALAAGRLDVVIGGPSAGMINAIAKGSAIKAVADEGQLVSGACNRNSIVASPRVLASGALRGLADLKGRKLAYNKFGIDAYWVHLALKTVGLDLRDVRPVSVPSAVLPTAIGKGDLDFAFVSEPTLTHVVSTGSAKDWVQVDKFAPGLQTNVVLFGPNLLTKNRGAGRKFVAANLRGIEEFATGKTESNIAAAAAFSNLSANDIRKTCWPTYGTAGRINWKSVDANQHWLLGQKSIDKTVTESQFMTDEFLR